MDGWDKRIMTEDEWCALQKTLSNTIGQNNYANWIAPLEFSCVDGNTAVFNVPTNFLGNYVSQNFGDILLYQISASNAAIKRVRFQVPETKSQRVAASEPSKRALSQNPKPEQGFQKDEQLPGAPLDRRFTFDTFVVGKPNELAHAILCFLEGINRKRDSFSELSESSSKFCCPLCQSIVILILASHCALGDSTLPCDF